MKRKRHRYKSFGITLCIAAALALGTAALASCGGTSTQKSESSVKLPPGVSDNKTQASSSSGAATTTETQSSSPSSQSSDSSQATAATPSAAAELYGANVTVVKATRPDTNKSVISSSGREVKGDYLLLELTILNNAADHLVDLSEYSFRLESPGIVAGSYSNYYGDTGTYGKYVSENRISATLLDYANLQQVAYKLKVGETVDKVFVFFDLNPENVSRNPDVSKDNTSFIIRKVSGTDYGDQVSIPLAGYPD